MSMITPSRPPASTKVMSATKAELQMAGLLPMCPV
jgi:hypothetical protein